MRRVGLALGAVLASVASVLGVGPFPALRAAASSLGFPTDAPAPLWTPTLLANGSFENGFSGWQAWPGEAFALYQAARGSQGDGSNYLETNTGSAGPGGSVYQDVAVPLHPGDSYTARILLRSPTATPIQVDVALWALGSAPAVVGQTTTTINSGAWQPVTVTEDVSGPGYGDLRLQVYLQTPGANLDLDGASLQASGLANPSFAEGFTAWGAWPGQAYATYAGASAVDNTYLETNTGSVGPGGNVYQDVSALTLGGHSYRASLFLRSPTGAPVSVRLAVWALGSGGNQLGQSSATVSTAAWAPLSATLDVGSGGSTLIRVQLFVMTPGVNVDLTGAQLSDAGVTNSSFEQGASGWSAWSGQNYVTYTTPGGGSGGGPAADDASYLETNTGSAGTGGSVYQDVHAQVLPGRTYTGAILVRSPSGAPVTVALAVWALGGAAAPFGVTQQTVSSKSWVPLQASVAVSSPGASILRLQLILYTTGVNVDADGASLQAQASTLHPLTGTRQLIVQHAESMDQYNLAYAENPLGSDCNIFSAIWGRGSTSGCPPGTSSEEWCSDFAAWAWASAGVDTSGITGWSFTFVNWGIARGSWKPLPTNDPQPGDAVIWGDWNAQYGQHVGIVVGSLGDTIDVVSGNSSHRVHESGWFDPTTSTVAGYPILGYIAPDGFTG